MSAIRKRGSSLPPLAPLEAEVMRFLWRTGECTAEQVQRGLARRARLTDSSIRTLLRRLEAKGMVAHQKDGKRYLYRALVDQHEVAGAAAKRIIDTICGGAVESLLLGLVANETVTAAELDAIRARIDSAESDD